jgi:hypothetical protein
MTDLLDGIQKCGISKYRTIIPSQDTGCQWILLELTGIKKPRLSSDNQGVLDVLGMC